MGPAAWRSGSPRRGPSASPGVRAAESPHAPEAPRQCPREIRTLRRAEGLDAAAVFAASGVTSGVKGKGGATPSIARDLDPAPGGAGRPAGVAPPLSTAENRITQRYGSRSFRDSVTIATVSAQGADSRCGRALRAVHRHGRVRSESTDPYRALARLTSRVLQSGLQLLYQAVRRAIADSVRLLLHAQNCGGTRIVIELRHLSRFDPDRDRFVIEPLAFAGDTFRDSERPR